MVRCVKVKLQEAETIKKQLLDESLIDMNFRPAKAEGFIYFPVVESYSGETVEYELAQSNREQAVSFKESLSKILTNEEMEIAKFAYDIVGSIAIMEVPPALQHKEQDIAQVLLNSNPLIETVLRKAGGHVGTFRTQEMKYLAGVETKIATYKENNCILTFDVEQVYFSSRLSTERKRIGDMVKEGEDILVMFCGAAPYPVVFAKNTEAKSIVGVEINPEGHKYGLLNVEKNKVNNVDLHCGDVREVVPKLNQQFDRILMPLPKTAEEFLDVALPVAKPGCMIHMYGFYHEDEFQKALDEVDKYCKAAGREYEVKEVVKCGQQSPRTYRICVDFLVK